MPVLFTCAACGKQKMLPPSSTNRYRYCSRECAIPNKKYKTHHQSKTRLHEIWCHMKTRCSCPTSVAYSYYGGRGISVCDSWKASFVAFRDWALANGYQEHLEIDRKDTNGNYEPGNCRWATRHQQMQNTRKRANAKTSRFRGVSWNSKSKKWRAQICGTSRQSIHIGMFWTEEAAAMAYDREAEQHFGEFAALNFR